MDQHSEGSMNDKRLDAALDEMAGLAWQAASEMVDERIPTPLVENLYHAVSALIGTLKEGETPHPKAIEDVEDAMAGIEEITHWDEQFRVIMDDQLKRLLEKEG